MPFPFPNLLHYFSQVLQHRYKVVVDRNSGFHDLPSYLHGDLGELRVVVRIVVSDDELNNIEQSRNVDLFA